MMFSGGFDPNVILTLADLVGVFVFALSGGIVAVRKDMDLFGVIVMAFLPAIGGGTLRDIILDVPVFWLDNALPLLLATLGGVAAFLGHRLIESFKPLRWADAIGMALFAVTGAATAAAQGHGVFVVLMMGVMTASAGGLLRDVVANHEPLLLKEDIYATAALLGSLVYFGLIYLGFDGNIAFGAGFAAGFILRALAIVFHWSLPKSPF